MFESSLVHNNGSRRGEGEEGVVNVNETQTHNRTGKHRPRIRVSAKARERSVSGGRLGSDSGHWGD